ncbi:Lipase (class 3) [Musa troglodytarum]|uniref:Lipase (Class 3) n=1 Tax=Musa troglodytarum TaxID=320322 RepID=A0A9E7F639_9LILI|nr:Lipase (class 3) [Musa troglodytarum]
MPQSLHSLYLLAIRALGFVCSLDRRRQFWTPMAAAAAATAAAVTVLLCLVLCMREGEVEEGEEGVAGGASDEVVLGRHRTGGRWRKRRQSPTEPPVTWMGKLVLVAGTIRFTFSETLGRWPLVDLLFGIRHHMRRRGNREVASVFAGSNCIELKGCGIMVDLIHMLRLLNLCFLFSKKPYAVLLESAGYTEDDVLHKEPKAGLLKPAFTILHDRNSKSFFLVIRGALSIKDKLTAATGELVPFHHLVSHEGSISNLITGYAHCGMVVAAHWIAKCATPCLLKAIIGHSMGAAIAAILSYILREHEEFLSSTCIWCSLAACMTWELAESGKHFVTTIVNATDLVPTFSAVSVDNLRSEIKASSWLTNQIQHTRILKGLYHFMTTFRSCVPSISVTRTRVTTTGKFLQPASESTEVVIRHAQHVAHAVVTCRSSVSCWSDMTLNRQAFSTCTSPDEEKAPGLLGTHTRPVNCLQASGCEEILEDQKLLQVNHVCKAASVEEMTEGEFWLEIEKELHHHHEDIQGLEKEKEESMLLIEAMEKELPTTPNAQKEHQLYPPGKLLHMVAVPALDHSDTAKVALNNRSIGIYETPRELYGKIRLSQTMIDDHYMPRYKKMMELLIDKLRRDYDGYTTEI